MVDHTPPSSDNDSDPKLQIQQNLKGDRNQIIGQAIDSTIFNFAGEGQVISLTINDRVPAASAPPPVSGVPTLTQQEYRQRQVLLNKVREYWIKGVLEKSLHTRALIALGLQERLDLVQQPFSGVAEFSSGSGEALPEGTQANKVFEQMGTGRTLLILGEPGAGKTITLLKLAEDLIARTESDLRQPIPVVFNLSSWARKPQAIEQWLVQELLEKYQVSKVLGKAWVETEALILLLDGLDEVKAEQRNACVQALNQFMQSHGTTEIAICSRIRDYQALTERLRLRSAICIQPLTPEQINSYFEQAGEQLSALKTVLQQDRELQELATSPLMLSIMSLAYQDCTREEITQGGRTEDYRKRLFEKYIDRMFQRRGTTQQYPREKTQRWLIWLAQKMTVTAQTMFLIERLQPSWLPSETDKIIYPIATGLILGVLLGLVAGIYFVYFYTTFEHNKLIPSINILIKLITIGVLSGLIPGLITGLLYLISNRLIKGLISGSIFAISISFFGSFIYEQHIDIAPILLSGICGGAIFSSIYIKIQPIESRELDLNKILKYAIFFGIIGILYALIKSNLRLNSYSVFEIIILMLFGAFIGGFRKKTNTINQQTAEPNEGICRSLKYTIITFFSLFFTVIFTCWAMDFSFHFNPVLICIGLVVGLIGGLGANESSGTVCIQHFTLRLILHCKNYIPWNYADFLEYAKERLFLQQVGGGYIFVHRMLLEHFAGMSLEQGQR